MRSGDQTPRESGLQNQELVGVGAVNQKHPMQSDLRAQRRALKENTIKRKDPT